MNFVVKDFWWWNLGKMSPHRSVRRGGREGRGGRGAKHNQPEGQSEGQPAVQVVDPTAPITKADFAAMEQRYRDMLFEALAHNQPAQQTQTDFVQTPTTGVQIPAAEVQTPVVA